MILYYAGTDTIWWFSAYLVPVGEEQWRLAHPDEIIVHKEIRGEVLSDEQTISVRIYD